MAYASWSVVAGEQPSAAKWGILGTNDAYFDSYIDRSGFPIQIVANAASAVSSGTTLIPLDDTIPQNTEGDQYMTQTITPTSSSSNLFIKVSIMLSNNNSNNLIAALFQDSNVNALAGGIISNASADTKYTLTFNHTVAAGTTSATTFKVRAGANGAGTTTFNGSGATRFFGTMAKSSLSVTEYRV